MAKPPPRPRGVAFRHAIGLPVVSEVVINLFEGVRAGWRRREALRPGASETHAWGTHRRNEVL